MRGRHDTNRLYGPRWNGEKKYLTFGLPAGRRMPPRKRSRVRDLCGLGAILTTGPNRGPTSMAEVVRKCPKPTCAGPPGRARACRVLCGPMGSGLPLSSSSSSSATLLSFWARFWPLRAARLFTTLLDARSLRRLRARHSSSRFLLALSSSSLLPSPSTPSLTSARAAKMRWFRGREREVEMLTVARVLRDTEKTLRQQVH